MAARHGTSWLPPWHGLRGSTFAQPTGWQRNTNQRRTASRVGISAVPRCLTGVRYGYHIALDWCQEGHNLPVHGGLANLQGVQGRRFEEGIATATVVVGTEDESGWCRCRWSQWIMASQSSWGKAFGWSHLNSGNGFTGNAGRTLGTL